MSSRNTVESKVIKYGLSVIVDTRVHRLEKTVVVFQARLVRGYPQHAACCLLAGEAIITMSWHPSTAVGCALLWQSRRAAFRVLSYCYEPAGTIRAYVRSGWLEALQAEQRY
jgi:hypothetical protein